MRRLLLAGVLAVACGGPVPTATPTPTPTPTSMLTPAPIGGQSLPGPGRLEPGTYTQEGFRPQLYFTVADGWTTVQQFSGFFDIQDVPGSLDVVAVQFTRATKADTAEEAAANIEGRADLSVSPRQTVTIGGLTGIRLTADTTDPADSDPVIFRPVLDTPAGPVSIGSGRRLQVDLFTVNDGVLAILVGGSIAQWERAKQLSAPVLESVVVGQ